MKYYKRDNRRLFWEERFKKQNGCCAICGNQARLVIDHDHSSGMMRGLLCYKHNTALGLFEDCPNLLERAAEYLRKHTPALLEKTKKKTDAYEAALKSKELIPKLLNDLSFPSDRARARFLAKETGCNEVTAQTRICRARRKLLTELEKSVTVHVS